MLKFALDTNCIVDLEEDRCDAHHLRKLLAAYQMQQIDLATFAVSASENQKGGISNQDYAAFVTKLKNVGLDRATQLLPMMIWDVFYWDHALWSSPDMELLASRLRDVLFPGVEVAPPAAIEENSRWRNQMCDVLVAWCCIHHGWPLVSRDENFHKKKAELAALGLVQIYRPVEAVDLAGA